MIRCFAILLALGLASLTGCNRSSGQGAIVVVTPLLQGADVVAGIYRGTHPVGGQDDYEFLANGGYSETCGAPICRGSWQYEADGALKSLWAQELDLIGPMGQIQLIFVHHERVYNAAFTLDEGRTLLLGALRRTSAPSSEVPGTYEMDRTVVTSQNSGTTTWSQNRQVTYLADGSWSSVTTTTDTSLAPPTTTVTETGTWQPGEVVPVSYQGETYLFETAGPTVFRAQ